MADSFCSICIDGTESLEPGDDGRLECKRCREEHPIYGGYSFAGGADRSIGKHPVVASKAMQRRKGAA